jgi:hypothetical protein
MKKVWYVVKPGLTRVTVKALVDKSRNNVKMLTGNAAFPDPKPKLGDVTELCDKLDGASQSYDFTRSRLDKEARDTYFEDLRGAIRDLSGYVQSQSSGDKDLIMSAGFDVEKSPAPFGQLPAPADVRALVRPYPGSIEVRFGGVKGRLSYQVFICSGDPKVESNWVLNTSTGKTRVMVDGLESNAMYFFRVVALGAAGFSPVSDVAFAKAA